jgi:hypothetical protein
MLQIPLNMMNNFCYYSWHPIDVPVIILLARADHYCPVGQATAPRPVTATISSLYLSRNLFTGTLTLVFVLNIENIQQTKDV